MSLPHYTLTYFCVVLYSLLTSFVGGNIPTVIYDNNAMHNLTVKYIYTFEKQPYKSSKVDVKFYYECLCPYCMEFDATHFKKVVQLLSEYLNIHTYPYGNARTINENGTYVFICQHGEEECYGNMLHACALHLLSNSTEALLYNSCMMTPSQKSRGSDDAAAERCGGYMNIDWKPIKRCAKGGMGRTLLKQYGDESNKANVKYVPYILINDEEKDRNNFIRDVCAAFASPPPPCAQFLEQTILTQ